ncbi:hypothetical protein E3N88_23585 [Mikania micrantha]|uniref:Uncharacterized protein n=1 Tax=Mikania micrantha TaxID=192012 RepID=A0A5N6NDX4_9ASTR|nr:hypothetical protein E3N88_23585 [Mikania micrantha]
MAGGVDDDAVLSDVEEEDNSPVPIVIGTRSSTEDVSIERFRELVAELDRERQAREVLEKSKSELQLSFNRLKALAHEAIKKRDECSRSNEKLSKELAEVVKEKDELLKQKDDFVKELEESVKAKDLSRSEIGIAAQMLVTGIEKISGKVNHFKNFMAGGLPRSEKYTGLPDVAYGVIKRTNEIVEELVTQIELATKSRNEAQEQMEQRNYEIAIELSELEAKISGLRDEVSKRTSVIKGLGKSNEKKDVMIAGLKTELIEKQSNYEEKLRILESQMDSQRPLLVNQLSHVLKIHYHICGTIKAGAIENTIKQSQIEIIELQHTVDELRAESSLLKENIEAQAKELLQSKQKLEELEEKERVANENVEGLMMDIAAAEEEITRWKVAAQQEAAAGKAVEEDYLAQLTTIRQDLEEAKQSVTETEKKLKFKEETAAAAMSARDAAETSLKLADTRGARLRERVEELTSQLEEFDTPKRLIIHRFPPNRFPILVLQVDYPSILAQSIEQLVFEKSRMAIKAFDFVAGGVDSCQDG